MICLDFFVLENWLLVSFVKNMFFKFWFEELLKVIELILKVYI